MHAAARSAEWLRRAFSKTRENGWLAAWAEPLTMAGLGYRSVSLLGASDLGIDTNQLMLVRLNTGASAAGVEENLALIERLRQRLSEEPQSAARVGSAVLREGALLTGAGLDARQS